MEARSTHRMFEGWSLLGSVILLVTAISIAVLASDADLAVAAHRVVRVTAWTSFALFMLAFTASAAATLFPGGLSHWQVRNRRYLGLGFAFSHLLHALAIIAYVRLAPELFWLDRTPASNIPGLIGYVFIALMAFTSFDATARLVGPRAWKLIHGVGIWVIWLDFVAASAKRVPENLGYAVPVSIGLAAVALRLIAAKRRSRSLAKAL